MINRRLLSGCLLLGVVLHLGAAYAAGGDDGKHFVEAVRQFADNVLAHGRDVYGSKHTPLFVDGLNVDTRAPPIWKHKGEVWIISNLASQQNLFRTLDGLAELTGEQKYRAAAGMAIKYAFANLRSPNGLIHWGGHTIYDAGGERIVGEGYKHELKYNLPYYELMWQVDPQATKQFIEAFWAAHILNWSNLDMNRHGKYTRTNKRLWANKYKGGPIFFKSKALPFLSTGTDLIYAAAILARVSNDAAPLVWAKRLAYRYVETRNPKTGMGGIQYNRYFQGDRAQVQFGEQVPGHLVLEGTLVIPRSVNSITGTSAICRLKLGELLGPAGKEFITWASEDLKAFASCAYDVEKNEWTPMLTDGYVLVGLEPAREGYYRPDQRNFQKWAPLTRSFWSYALAWRVTGDEQLWEMARNVARYHTLGDIGAPGGVDPRLNLTKNHSRNPNLLLGLLELYKKTKHKPYLMMAMGIGDNILKRKFRKGFFVRSDRHVFAKFDAVEPLVLLQLAAALQGRPTPAWEYWGGRGFFHCPHDGLGRTYDNTVIYAQRSKAPVK